jgi:hypothetical protein
MFSTLAAKKFQIQMLHHAEAILRHDMGSAAAEIEAVLDGIQIPVEELVRGGGGQGPVTQRVRQAFRACDWEKHNFQITKVIDGENRESTSHEIDHVKRFGDYTFALEIEWNNKDPFFDRDLENFKRLHTDGAISIGCIITRGESLQASMRSLIESFAIKRNVKTIEQLPDYCRPTVRQRGMYEQAAARLGTFAQGWAHAFVGDKFGEATTHWRKLQDRVHRGVGNPCPLLLIGIPASIVLP